MGGRALHLLMVVLVNDTGITDTYVARARALAGQAGCGIAAICSALVSSLSLTLLHI